MGRLQNKVALITGAGSGIGESCMQIFAKEGATLFGVSRTKSKVDAIVADVEKAGGKAKSMGGDMSKEEDCKASVEACIAAFGRIDILVNNAGLGYSHAQRSPHSMDPIETTPTDKWREVMGVNLDSIFFMSKFAIPHMRKSGGGSIINVASILGLVGNHDAHTYTAAKGAIVNLTRSMAITYAADNIRANTLAPGYIDTPLIASVVHVFDDPATAKSLSPMGRAGRPEEIAYGALFLASDEASFCTGSVLVIDGGTLAKA